MAQRFRRPCSPLGTRSNPARPFSSFASFGTTSYQRLLPVRRPLVSRHPPPQEKCSVLLPLRFARPSFRRRPPCPLPQPRQSAPTRCPIRPPLPLHSKIDRPHTRASQRNGRPRPARQSLPAPP